MAYGNYAPFYRGGFFNPMQTPQMPMADNQFTQPYQQPMQINPAPMPTQPINDMIWVLGQTEAESYPVALNNSVVLWDKNNPTIYVKSVNANGMPSMRVLDFTERTENSSKQPTEHVCKCGDNFVTKADFEALKTDFEALTAKYEELTHPAVEKPKTTTKKSKEAEE